MSSTPSFPATAATPAAPTKSPTLFRVFQNNPSLPPDTRPDTLTTGQIAIAHLEAHLAYYRGRELLHPPRDGASSLSDLALQKITEALCDDTSSRSLQIILDSCPPSLLDRVLAFSALPYSVFCMLSTARLERSQASQIQVAEVDEWVLGHERAMRKLAVGPQMRMLVELERDGDAVWPDSVRTVSNREVRTLVRKEPPREAFAVLGEKRERALRVLSTNSAFSARFDRLTGGLLEGLDWRNVFVAGGMALNTLLCVEDAMEDRFKDSDVDLYIYGLQPAAANEKIKEIYGVWWRNLGPLKPTFCVKNAKTITLISSYPERRIQIILKYVTSPAEVLLNFDLDQCALGWNGSEVLMLPRCARALETGYSIFTTDLVYGHYLSNRRATQETRVFKYADRGFGILFPASLLSVSEVDFGRRRHHVMLFSSRISWPSTRDAAPPQGVLTGKKAVKKITWNAVDLVHRFYLGRTPGTALAARDTERNVDTTDNTTDSEEDVGDDRNFCTIEVDGVEKSVPLAEYTLVNGRHQHQGQPGGRFGLKMFETFMRMVEMWRLDFAHKIKLDKNSFESTEYADSGYDDLPKYKWDENFRHDTFERAVEEHNHKLFERCRNSISRANGAGYTPRREWTGFLTRRFRRIVTGHTLDEVMQKQLTLPLWVPAEVDDYISAFTASFPPTDANRILIPGMNPRYNGHLRPIPATTISGWRFRVWVIGNETMWARARGREWDEVGEMLWTLFHMAHSTNDEDEILTPPNPQDALEARRMLAAMLERRPVPAQEAPGKEQEIVGCVDSVEKRRWNDWLADLPFMVFRTYTNGFHGLYQEKYDLDPPEEWYWDEGVDGGDDGGVWRSVDEEGGGEGKGKDAETSGAGVGAGDVEVIGEMREHVGLKRKREDSGLEGMVVGGEPDPGEETE